MLRMRKIYQILFATSLMITLGISTNPSDWSSVAIAASPEIHVASEADTDHNNHRHIIPLFDNLGRHHHPISTANPRTQRYFNQGLVLAYGFNHAEALRSFQYAAELDPTCAICYWGMAYVLGPNINAAMEDAAVPTAWDAIQQAIELSQYASDRERAYIAALALRYTPEPVEDRSELNLNYANAMGQVAERYPNDPDAATLYAEALMDTTPWDYWQENGEPSPAGAKIIATLESVLQQHPEHPGALHLYIHAVEAERPELAATAADRLRALNINTGHLIHMPSHIYVRVGRYHDAVVANQLAAAADHQYHQAHPSEDLYRIAYMPHNHHFLWYAAIMAGQREVGLQAANDTAALVKQSLLREPGYGTLQHYSIIPLYTYVRFGMWDEILAQPAPAEDLVYPQGVWHFARGMAFTAQGQVAEAEKELAALQQVAADPVLQEVTIWDINTTAHLLQIATEVLAGELAAKRGSYEEAIAHLQTAVQREDSLNYDEPAPWYAPVRQTLGAVLLQAGRLDEAEQVYRDDLDRYPNNGWSLFGLVQSLQAQGKTSAAEAAEEQFEAAWQNADVTLVASRF